MSSGNHCISGKTLASQPSKDGTCLQAIAQQCGHYRYPDVTGENI
ncbi:MAG: hypothetical protein WBA93_19580 [Microcoleaceae cyanobacterium]